MITKKDAISVEETMEHKTTWTKEQIEQKIVGIKKEEKKFQDMLNLFK